MTLAARPPGTDRATRYPPLVLLAAALVLALFALPSGLILPQANPEQTTEYAPVPANGNASPGGNFAGLGLGSSATLGGGGGLPGPPPGQGANPSSKECVGNPPRQTEDPLAPPCVAFFSGDNGGATYRGVTRSQITVLFYLGINWQYANCGTAPASSGYYDLDSGQSDGTCVGRNLKTWERYFNSRFQTYDRTVHFWIFYSQAQTAADRRADATNNYQRLHPFAVVAPPGPFAQAYLDSYQQAINGYRVLYFTSLPFEPSAFYQRYAPLLWGYAPSLEEQARNWASYVCAKIEPYPSSFAGPLLNGRPRLYGAVETTDTGNPLLQQFQSTALSYVRSQCGVKIYDTATYPINGFFYYAGTSPDYSSYAAPQMARFARENVTTVLWPGGYETQFSQAAGQLKYYPEWVTAGDGLSDGWEPGPYQDQTVWAHDIVVTPQARIENSLGVSSTCVAAYASVDPSASSGDIQYGCEWYAAVFQMFVGLQVAGPRLTPTAMDQGYHAIPAHPSSDPEVPACFYDPGDYTCVKDATAQYWDSTLPNPYDNLRPGCYRMPDAGARYLTRGWPSGAATAQRSSADPCNGYAGHAYAVVAFA